MVKKKFMDAEVEVVRFANEDIVTASGGMTVIPCDTCSDDEFTCIID